MAQSPPNARALYAKINRDEPFGEPGGSGSQLDKAIHILRGFYEQHPDLREEPAEAMEKRFSAAQEREYLRDAQTCWDVLMYEAHTNSTIAEGLALMLRIRMDRANAAAQRLGKPAHDLSFLKTSRDMSELTKPAITPVADKSAAERESQMHEKLAEVYLGEASRGYSELVHPRTLKSGLTQEQVTERMQISYRKFMEALTRAGIEPATYDRFQRLRELIEEKLCLRNTNGSLRTRGSAATLRQIKGRADSAQRDGTIDEPRDPPGGNRR